MIFENYSQSNVFVTGENLARRMRWVRRRKKKVELWGEKLLTFFGSQSSSFFSPDTERRKGKMKYAGLVRRYYIFNPGLRVAFVLHQKFSTFTYSFRSLHSTFFVFHTYTLSARR